MAENANDTSAGRKSSQIDAVYLAAVGGLLVLICAALAVLWVIERRHRIAAESEARQLRVKLSRYEQFQRLGGGSLLSLATAPPATQPALEPVRREALAVQTVEYAGESREVLLIPADVGRRFGFQVGDLILVSKPPRSAPSTKPAGGAEQDNAGTRREPGGGAGER